MSNSSAISSSSAAAAAAVAASPRAFAISACGSIRERASRFQYLLQAAPDRGRRGVGTAALQMQQGTPRLRILAERLRLCEGLVGAVEVAGPQADLAQLVERLGGGRRQERFQLVRRPLRLRLRFGPGTREPHELGPVHAADPGKPVMSCRSHQRFETSAHSVPRR